MKKLVLPIAVGVAMFALAFGGAFYFYNYKENAADEHARSMAETTLQSLQEQGELTAYTTHLTALVSAAEDVPAAANAQAQGDKDEPTEPAENKQAQPKEAEKSAAPSVKPAEPEGEKKPDPVAATQLPSPPSGPLRLVPATVRYSINIKGMKPEDMLWDKQEKILSVKVPELTIGEPEIDINAIQQLKDGRFIAVGEAKDVLSKPYQKAAMAALIKQAEDPKAVRQAKEATRAAIKNIFAASMRVAELTGTVEVYFADELDNNDENGGNAAEQGE